MLVYWIIYAFPSLFGMVEQSEDDPHPRFSFPWLLMFAALALIIGFRWQTGGDWGNYNDMVTDYFWQTINHAQGTDPGFDLLLWIAARLPAGMLLVTGISGTLMAFALTRFCLAQPRPWLAMVVSIPFMVVIMGMGYIRQGMAISLLMLGILALSRGSILRFIVYLVVAATFHSTAVVLAPFAAFITNRYRFLTIGMAALLTIGLAGALLFGRAESFSTNYVEEGMSSTGAASRLVMTALAAVMFLVFRKRIVSSPQELGFWRAFAIVPIALFVLLPVFPSSTVLDRLGLYFLPLQTFVAGRLPDAIGRSSKERHFVALAIIALYALAFFVWLNYAVNVNMWLPYRSWFFEDGVCLQC